jgi:hypothetical protein
MNNEKIFLVGILLYSLVSGCNSSNGLSTHAKLQNLPDSIAKNYLDSLAWSIEKSISYKMKGFPSPKKDTSYYEERPYYDSLRKLKKVTIYEFYSDTLESHTDFYYWDRSLIAMRNITSGSGKVIGGLYYVFKNGRKIDSSLTKLPPISTDTVLKRSTYFLSKFDKQ